MCCAPLAENTGCKNYANNRHPRQLRYVSSIDNRKKLVKRQYLLHMSSQYGNFGPRTVGEFGAPQQISTRLCFITAPT